jgi:lipopolysaccharide/colanic/teichoic acid biosynthesis glycosyltransferase/nucleoside-diphosphate-sugar epimerase
MSKRAFDVVVAAVGLALTWPVFLVLAALIKLDTRGPVFFRQERVGRDGRLFRIYKFRTMVDRAYALGPRLTQKRDPRITRVGLILRWLKLDELPQLINVLVGDMSFVGPRPEDPHFVALYSPAQRQVLAVRPGIVGPSQIAGRDETEMYPEGVDTERYYIEHILPQKLATDLAYVRRASLACDLRMLLGGIAVTVFGSVKPKYLRQARQKLGFAALDLGLSLLPYLVAWGLKFDWRVTPEAMPYLGVALAAIILVRPLVFAYFGLYQNILKYFGTSDFAAVVKAVTVGSAIITGALLITGFGRHSRAVLVIDWMLLIVVLFGYRLWLRARAVGAPGERAPAIIAGAHDMGEELARQLIRNPSLPYAPVGFVDDDLLKQNALIHGVRVLGTVHDLPALARLKNARMVLIPSPVDGSGDAGVEAVIARCRQARLDYRVLPALDHLLNGTVGLDGPGAPPASGAGHAGGANGTAGNGAAADHADHAEAPGAGERRRTPRRDGSTIVLVTGGAGYIGSWLTRKLLDRDYRVRVLDSFLYGDQGLRDIMGHPRLELIEGDIRHLGTVARAAKGVSGVIALAALVGDAACDLDPEETMATNFESVRLLADVCRRHEVPRLVFASSCSVYGANSDLVLNEGSWLNPVSLYARTRIDSEEYLLRHADDLGVVVLRLATVFGLSPRMRFDLLVNTLTLHAMVNRKMMVFGGGQWRPNLHVQDAAEAFICGLEAPGARVHRGIFNVGANENNHTIREVAEMVRRHVPEAEMEIKTEQGDRRDYRVAFDKIRQVLGFQPRFTVEDGIREIADALAAGRIENPFDDVYHNYRHLKLHARPPALQTARRGPAAVAAR